MESKEEEGIIAPPPLTPFYMEEFPLFQYDPDDPTLIQRKKEEILSLRLCWGIRSKGHPMEWVEGLKSKDITQKWLNEAKEKTDFGDLDPYSDPAADRYYRHRVKVSPISRISRRIWEGVIDGLDHYGSLVDGRIQPGPLAGVTWMGDGLVGQGLRDGLLIGSEALDDVARKEGNWDPGTEGRVLNLIDPSMHALIPGQTRVLELPFIPDQTNGQVGDLAHFVSPSSPSPSRVHGSEDGFQWLPAEVDVGLDGVCHFRSYVNNLNPFKEGEMYEVLEEILSTTFVPLWVKLLIHMRRDQEEGEDSDDDDENEVESEAVDLKGRRIQVIVRMATTHLTPDNPKHPGGQWHVDGMPEEKIVAVGLRYYSNQNITTAELGLGEKFLAPLPGWKGKTWIRNSRELATIETKEGRSLVFSNHLNHRVLPFELENPALPGHRKILAFFLVDPGAPILSTARVPCQQRSWFLAKLKRVFSPILPPEMVEKVHSFLDTPLDLNKETEFRDVMRKKRSCIVVRVISDDRNEEYFKMEPSIRIDKLKRAFCQKRGTRLNEIRFLFKGRRINDDETPAGLGMETGDVIDMYREQTGD